MSASDAPAEASPNEPNDRNDAAGVGADSSRPWARAVFVVVFALIGAVVAIVLSQRSTTAYRAETIVSLPPESVSTDYISDAQATYSSDAGASLNITPDGNSLRFVAEAPTSELATSTADDAAIAFVAAQGDLDIAVVRSASEPESPAGLSSTMTLLLGIGIGSLVGLGLQPALRPPRRDPSVTYIPAWTDQPRSSGPPPPTALPESEHDRVRYDTIARDDNIGAEGHDEADPEDNHAEEDCEMDDPERSDRPADDPRTFDDGSEEIVLDLTESPQPTRLAAMTESPEHPEEPAVAPPDLQNLLSRTSANIDPLVDRFAETDRSGLFVDEIVGVRARPRPSSQAFQDLKDFRDAREAAAEARSDHDEDGTRVEPSFMRPEQAAPSASAPRRDTTPEANEGGTQHLVEQITFLTDELSRYQDQLRDERAKAKSERAKDAAGHARQVDELTEQLAEAAAAAERASADHGSAIATLEARIGDLQASLATSEHARRQLEDDLSSTEGRHKAHEDDLASQNQFLREEVERYQSAIEADRVGHSTALAAVELERQEEVDRIHRDHRETLNQLAHTNRNLLATQRNDSDLALAALEADHQRRLEEAHAEYEARTKKLRGHFEEKLATSEERIGRKVDAEREAELAQLRQQLEAARNDVTGLNRRLQESEAQRGEAERAATQQRLDREQHERADAEERRSLAHRAKTLEDRLARAEARLAEERRRTGDVVRNLLEDSASSVAKAEQARLEEIDGRATLEAQHRKELEALAAETRAIEQAAAKREATLEATIAGLRNRVSGT